MMGDGNLQRGSVFPHPFSDGETFHFLEMLG